ncbi:MAG: GSU2403 family nucleotidyltransferase fold protein, partial [Novosphingobium sp.]
QVVPCRDGSPARIVAPDPRWFALHKLWLSKKPTRNPLKRPKDRKQGVALLNAVAEVMPQFPLDAAFSASIPAELVEEWGLWLAQRPAPRQPGW